MPAQQHPQLPSAADASLTRRMNEQLVLGAIFRDGPLTRVAVAKRTGLSKPTVSSIVDDLVDAGLVHQGGRTSGGIGRTAALYRVDGRVGNVVGIDLGGTKVSGAVADLHGTVLAERTEPTNTDAPAELLAQVRSLATRLAEEAGVDWSRVRALAIGVPGTVDPDTGRIGLAYNIPDLSGVSLGQELAVLGADLEVVVENDVNLAAIGERSQGWASGCEHFAFVAIGTGIGAGVVVNGELCRGVGGAGGEIGYLPFGEDPFDPQVDRRGPLEAAIAGRGVSAYVERQLSAGVVTELQSGCSPVEVFEAANRGDELASRALDREARLIAMTIASLAAVVSPEL